MESRDTGSGLERDRGGGESQPLHAAPTYSAMADVRYFLSRPLLRLSIWCGAPLVVLPLAEFMALSPCSTALALLLGLPMGLTLLAAILALPLAPFLLLVPRLRSLGAHVLLACGLLLIAGFIGSFLGNRVRMAPFHRLAERSAPLVQAIRTYRSLHLRPPPDLAALVPDLLPSIPGTGMAQYPSYEYYVGAGVAPYHDNPWALVVFTPSGLVNFDQFLYFPLQNYPKRGYGGHLERVADWAYVHE